VLVADKAEEEKKRWKRDEEDEVMKEWKMGASA
jgi:hypothetical protein